ncbi:MAG: peptide MFS transporter [Alphaproteobacteria bacterium]|nr:peptide MFS transporter [Alphaproteobacteria bacterium]
MDDAATPMSDGHDWFGHPRGLTILFLTEMWSQFSFFGMRALLVYYMTKELLIGQAHSSYIYGIYSSFVYFTPLIGGAISDHWLGRRRAVILGASIMAFGHFMMAFEPLFYPALATIVIGNGLFLPSLASQINYLYAPGDPRRATAYNVYYVGVNLGAFLAPFVCGTVGELYGWHWGFALAGIGMMIGLLTYLGGGRYLPRSDAETVTSAAPALDGQTAAQTRTAPGTYLLLASVIAIVVIFRAAYEQSGNTIALWADSGIDRHVGAAFQVPMTWFQSLNPLMIFLFTPVIVAWWARAARRGRAQSTLAKMATGGFVVALSYLLLASVAAWAGPERANWLWLVLFFLVYTTGELFILPVGLGLFGRLAPRGFAATAIAAWFVAAFFGNLAAGGVGSLWSTMTPATFFVVTGVLAALSGALLLCLVPWARGIEAGADATLRSGSNPESRCPS